ncbi:hypothetical protein R3P38DRAFT_2892380 [Favolaschia claudopus]|uniref:BTB domain-containing protein n=1 Tax=Favolaschia claudopus TaxID=2862362 RepID=A0AAW0CYH2_9AGAR
MRLPRGLALVFSHLDPMSPPSAPFNSPANSDTILRSCDGINFHVHSAVLSLASPFFNTMFTLPVEDHDKGGAAVDKGLPVVEVSESSELLDRFLRVWYPGAEMLVEFSGFEELQQIIELTLSKYDIQSVAPLLRHGLRHHLQEKSVTAFAIACKYDWADIARAAAKETLKHHISFLYLDERLAKQMQGISVAQLLALLRYHAQCSRNASEVSAATLLVTDEAIPSYFCGQCYTEGRRRHSSCTRAAISRYLEEVAPILKDSPGIDIRDLIYLSKAHEELALCDACRRDGLRLLGTFIKDAYLPAIHQAIDKVQLEI